MPEILVGYLSGLYICWIYTQLLFPVFSLSVCGYIIRLQPIITVRKCRQKTPFVDVILGIDLQIQIYTYFIQI